MAVTYNSNRISILLIFLCWVVLDNATAQVKIPNNIAYGAPTRGGLDGKIMLVTTLKGEGPGSLREAVEASGPRIVVFEVGGVIDLNMKSLSITEPFLTIAGQTAPSPGITVIKGGFHISTHDVVIQHIRVRPGDAGQPKKSGWEPDGLTTSGGDAHDVIIDHCSFTWAVDENLSASGARTNGPDSTSRRITFSNNIIAEGLDNSSHSKGRHSKGTLIHDFCRDIAIVGNLFAHNAARNPYFKAYTQGAIVNNLIYNPGRVAIQLGFVPAEWNESSYKPQNCQVSIVGNVLYKGVNSRDRMALAASLGDAFLKDNLAFEVNGEPLPMTAGDVVLLNDKPSWPVGLEAMPATKVLDYVTGHAGARPKERDEVDRRIIQNFHDRTGRIIDSQEEVGGYPTHKETRHQLIIPKKDIEAWLLQLASDLE